MATIPEQVHLPALIADNMGMSRSRARQLIDTRNVSLDGRVLEPGEHDVTVESGAQLAVRVPERRTTTNWQTLKLQVVPSVSICARCRRPVELGTVATMAGLHWVVGCRNSECPVGVIDPRDAESSILQVSR